MMGELFRLFFNRIPEKFIVHCFVITGPLAILFNLTLSNWLVNSIILRALILNKSLVISFFWTVSEYCLIWLVFKAFALIFILCLKLVITSFKLIS